MPKISKFLQTISPAKYTKQEQKLLKEGVLEADDILPSSALSNKVKRDEFVDAEFDEDIFLPGSSKKKGMSKKQKAGLAGLGGLGALGLTGDEGGEEDGLGEVEPAPSSVPLTAGGEEPVVEDEKKDKKKSYKDILSEESELEAPIMKKAPSITFDLAKELSEMERPLDQAEEYGIANEEYEKSIAQAYDAYQQTKDKEAQGALWESLINGIGHLAAGVIGQKEGLDLSGVKFDKTDWEAKAAQNMSELRSAVASAKDVRVLRGDALDRQYKRRLDILQQNERLRDTAFNAAVQNVRLEQDQERINEGKKQQFIDNLYKEKAYKLRLAELAKEEGDVETAALLKRHNDLDKRIADLTSRRAASDDKKVRERLGNLINSTVQEYDNVSKKLDIESPAYSSADVVKDEGWFSSINIPSEIKRKARLSLESFDGENASLYKQAYKEYLQNPNAPGASKAAGQLEAKFPGLITGELD